MANGVVIKYSDIAVDAKESFDITTGAKIDASNVDLIKTEGAFFGRYDIPFELNSMLLDGGAQFLPENELANIGFISEELSNSDGRFEEPILIELHSSSAFTSSGLTFKFDEIKNIYPTHINICWYNGDTLLEDSDFYPNKANYFCNKKVEFYNKILISFYSLNLPNNRLRINHIDYGLVTEFTAKELRSAKMIQEIDPVSTSIPINTFDFTIDTNKGIDFSFQTRQPIDVMFDGVKKATTFVKKARKKAKTMWDVQSEDYIGLMNSIYFKGGIYQNKKVVELIEEIFVVAKVPYEISLIFESITVSGYIPYTTCRDALMQVVFAIGAVVDTSNSNKVKIFALDNEVSQHLPKRRILQGQSFEDDTRVTAVELVKHFYSEIDEQVSVYNANKSGIGSNLFILFSEPLHDLSIINGEIVESGTNYAIINANNGCELFGKKYEHTKLIQRKNNPLVISTDVENIVTVEKSTLTSYGGNVKLPDGYRLLKYLESSGTQYIDTEFIPNQDSRVVFDGYNTSSNSTWFFGVWGGATNVKGFGTSFKYCSYASNNTAFASQIGVGELQIDQNKNTYTVNGTSGSYTAETFSSGYPLYLFALNKAGTKGGAFYGRMYSCQIYDNDTLVRDYLPCINAEGEYGLYDTVGKKFYGNAGTGTFIGSLADELPKDYTLLEYIESNGTQYIDTDFVPNSNVRVLMDVEGYSATEDPNTCLFGSNSSSSDYFRLIVTSGKLYRSYFGSATANFASTVDYTGRTIVDFNKNVCTIGDSSVTATASTFNGTQSLYLFANNTSGSAVIPTSAKLCSCQIYNNGTIVRDYIPCINASGEYGLYDKLNKKFYGNAGSGSFTGESALQENIPSSSMVVDNVLDLCYNYFTNTSKSNMKIVDGKKDINTNVGDLITFDTEYLGEKQGRIIKQTFSLVGGIIVKDSEVK